MYTDDDLRAMLLDFESELVERKENASRAVRNEVKKAVCAFANDLHEYGRAGVVFLGVRDAGSVCGVEITDDVLLQLTSIRNEGTILPIPTMSVRRWVHEGHDLIVIEVEPTADPPVRFQGRVWVRNGPSKASASRDDERILTEKRRSANAPFDQRSVQGVTYDDVSLEDFQRDYLPAAVDRLTLQQNERTVEHQLRAQRLAGPDGLPNPTALLMFGRDPQAWLRGGYVQFVRYDGTEVTDPIVDQQNLSGPIPAILLRADDLIRANTRARTVVAGQAIEQRRPDYPFDALQQLLRNAVMHRNYETSNAPVQLYWFRDRVEIISPGGLFGRVNTGNFGDPGMTDYRNPTLAEAMKVLGFVQRFGMGVPMSRRSCADNGNPPPEFQIQPGTFGAIVRAAP